MGATFTHQRQLQLFPATGPFKFIAVDILGPLPQSRSGNQVMIIITDWYSKLTRTIPTPKLSSTYVAHTFRNDWVIRYGICNTMDLSVLP